MREDNRSARQREIEEAAYRVLQARGYGGTSMLSVAREANASNETLYRWYGDKRGLCKALVESNAAMAVADLKAAIDADADPVTTLREIGPVLLAMLLGERAIALNRAAAADQTGELGATIAAAGREAVFPLISGLVQRAMDAGRLTAPLASLAAEWFVALLVQDQQIRRAIGVMPPPTQEEVAFRAHGAWLAFARLCAIA